MDRHPQQIKRERQDLKRHERNMARLSEMRTAIKKVLQAQDAKEAESLYRNAVKLIDQLASKGNLHKNKAARHKSQITKYMNSLSD